MAMSPIAVPPATPAANPPPGLRWPRMANSTATKAMIVAPKRAKMAEAWSGKRLIRRFGSSLANKNLDPTMAIVKTMTSKRVS